MARDYLPLPPSLNRLHLLWQLLEHLQDLRLIGSGHNLSVVPVNSLIYVSIDPTPIWEVPAYTYHWALEAIWRSLPFLQRILIILRSINNISCPWCTNIIQNASHLIMRRLLLNLKLKLRLQCAVGYVAVVWGNTGGACAGNFRSSLEKVQDLGGCGGIWVVEEGDNVESFLLYSLLACCL